MAIKNKYGKWLFIFLIGMLFVAMLFVGIFRKNNQNEPIEYGVSFSEKYARELGLEPEEAYEYLITNLNIEKIRLMSYWDIREPKKDEYDFKFLDWMMDGAEREEIEVSLAIGVRQPRWPECHLPAWAENLNKESRDKELLEYIEEVIGRYKNHPALNSYQLENEAANRHFGTCPKIDRSLIAKEYNLVKKLDPEHTLIINTSNQSGIPLREPRAEKVGFSVYEHAHFALSEGGKQRKWNFWYVPSSWHALRASILETIYAEETFIHELQAEPWGKSATKDLSNEKQLELMSNEKLKKQVDFAKNTGMREMYLWGVEWWYWRIVNYNDDSFITTANKLFTQQNTSL